MPSLLACLGCGRGAESDEIHTLDYCHASLTDVPADVFACERTLEELFLDSNQLSELPRQLFYCHGLKVLGLSDNELTSLPPAVASLINLTTLDLSKNAISDIPDNIKGCKQLSVVDASINPLCRLPEGFTQLLSLQELYLNDTFLEYLPANFGRLSRLKILELRENQLNTLPKSIARLTSLQRLDIGQNDFSELPEVIGSLGNLTELWFDNNKVKSLPPMLGRLKKLVHVDASKNKVDWVAGELEHCTLLTDLHLSSNNLTELPEKLGMCRQLQVLKLDDNALTHLPESIGGLAYLQELVVSQNDVETLPASMGLLRALHTLHLDDNLLTELPPELGSCVQLRVLTVASNRLTSVPAELGHLPHLVVLNLCDNLIPHLPVSLTKLKLRALWLSENQNKPQVQLQSETQPDTGQRVLTCFMLPQQPKQQSAESVVETDNFPGQGWDEQRRAKTLIKFAFDGDVDKPGRLTRAPTPYPKELKALAKHARNLHSLQKDSNKQFVLGRSQEGSKISPTVPLPSQDAKEPESARKRQESLASEKRSSVGSAAGDSGREEVATPLTIIEPQPAEDRPMLREARNVRNASGSTVADTSEGLVNGSRAAASTDPSHPYAIGDRKVVGHAQVVAMSSSRERSQSETRRDGGEEGGLLQVKPTPTEVVPLLPQDPSGEGEAGTDGADKRIKKPPPYHIAAVMSRRASDFSESSVEVSSLPGKGQAGVTLTVKELQPLRQSSTTSPVTSPSGEDENNDTSSSSDSGYGNGRLSHQKSTEDQPVSDRSSVNTASSPLNLTDPNTSMPTSPSSPQDNTSLSLSHAAKTYSTTRYSSSDQGRAQPLSPTATTTVASSTSANIYGVGKWHSPLASSPASPPASTTLPGQVAARPCMNRLQSEVPYYRNKPNNRPASIATGTQLEMNRAGPTGRPGSLALGVLADSSLLNKVPREQRPGSLAAPINTLGIPPAPTRAVSHMGLNVTAQAKPFDHSMFRSQNLAVGGRNWAPDHRETSTGPTTPRQESNGLVSIIDQVTSSLLEHGDSPPPKMPDHQASPATTAPDIYSHTSSRQDMGGQKSSQEEEDEALAGQGSCVDGRAFLNTSTISSTSSVGPTNFTQDQPRGEVLHPTPHRPNFSSSSSSGVSNVVQDGRKDEFARDQQQGDEGKVNHVTGHPNEAQFNGSERDVSPTTQKSISKLPSRIPSLSPEGGIGIKAAGKDSPHNSSQVSHSLHESRIPSLGNIGRSPSSLMDDNQSLHESKIPTLGMKGRSPSNLSAEHKTSTESKIPSINSGGQTPRSITAEKQVKGETRIPSLASAGRSSSSLTNDSIKPDSNVIYGSVHESQTTGDSRIPVLGRTSSNLTQESLSAGLRGSGSSTTGNTSSIPSLSAQGRSLSNLRPGSTGPGTAGSLDSSPYGNIPGPRTMEAGHTPQSVRLRAPAYSSGIRTPSIQSPSQQLPSPADSSRGYTSHIRPPAVNAAINTTGIPIMSPVGGHPGSRGSITSVGSSSRIPVCAGATPTKLPGLGTGNTHRVTPAAGHSDSNKANQSAWMFGQHKNARVVCQNFPVVIEKNPDLGFTVGQSHADPEDKSIYVTSVAGGGSASSALKVGDKLLQVDGVDLRVADLPTASSILAQTATTVNLMVSRLQ